MSAQISRVSFMDGAAGDSSTPLFLAADLQSGRFNLTRLFIFRGADQWHYVDFPSVVTSVDIAPAGPGRPKQFVALGRDGKVFYTSAGSEPLTEQIWDAGTGKGKLGYINRVRYIGDSFYACGHRGQVYRRTSRGWLHIDKELVDAKSERRVTSHNGIDGTGNENIYVVGDHGQIFNFDGETWRDVSPETNVDLESIKCVSANQVLVVGARGLILEGNKNGWRKVADGDVKGDIWDVAIYGEKTFVSVDEHLMTVDEQGVHPVKSGLEPELKAYRFSRSDNLLWSIGESDLTCFDGEKWTRLYHPDND